MLFKFLIRPINRLYQGEAGRVWRAAEATRCGLLQQLQQHLGLQYRAQSLVSAAGRR